MTNECIIREEVYTSWRKAIIFLVLCFEEPVISLSEKSDTCRTTHQTINRDKPVLGAECCDNQNDAVNQSGGEQSPRAPVGTCVLTHSITLPGADKYTQPL